MGPRLRSPGEFGECEPAQMNKVRSQYKVVTCFPLAIFPRVRETQRPHDATRLFKTHKTRASRLYKYFDIHTRSLPIQLANSRCVEEMFLMLLELGNWIPGIPSVSIWQVAMTRSEKVNRKEYRITDILSLWRINFEHAACRSICPKNLAKNPKWKFLLNTPNVRVFAIKS